MKINEISENISHTSKRLRDIERNKGVKPGTPEWFKLWFSLPYLKESTILEGYRIQLERGTDMDVLHIVDTKTGKRTEVRGKSGYEVDYDPADPLHQLLDKIGKAANISDLINGEVTGINTRHPDGNRASAETDRAFNESVSGEEMLKMFQQMHHDAGMNPDMDEWVKSQEWGIDTIKPEEIVDFEELFDYDDPFDRIINVDEQHVKSYMAAIQAGRKLDPVILGPKHSDGKYSIVDGNHRALAYAALGQDIPVYMPMNNISEALDQPYPVRWSIQNNNEWYGHAKEENVYDQIGISIKRITNGTWDINFSVNDTKQKSGGGDQFKIFATVKAAVQEWWNWASKNTDVNKIKFSAERIADTSRVKLYQRFAKQFADAIGYNLKVDSDRNYDTYNIEKPNVEENFADGKVKGKSRPGRVKRAGASCKGSVTDLRKRAKKYSGERGKMYHWCANMKAGKKK